jgi:predicted alpha/beta superfamily hydrolase
LRRYEEALEESSKNAKGKLLRAINEARDTPQILEEKLKANQQGEMSLLEENTFVTQGNNHLNHNVV